MIGKRRAVALGVGCFAAGALVLWQVLGGGGAPPEPAAPRPQAAAPAGQAAPPLPDVAGAERRDGEGGAAGQELPPEVLAAIEGRPPEPQVEFPLEVELMAQAAGDGGRGDAAGDGARGAAGDDGEAANGQRGDARLGGPGPTEAERRAVWVDRQERRNQLRVEVMAEELGLDAAQAEAMGEVLERSLRERIALFESLDEQAPDEARLADGLAQIRADLIARLTAVLGAAGYARFEELDRGGYFVLPEEVKRPPQ